WSIVRAQHEFCAFVRSRVAIFDFPRPPQPDTRVTEAIGYLDRHIGKATVIYTAAPGHPRHSARPGATLARIRRTLRLRSPGRSHSECPYVWRTSSTSSACVSTHLTPVSCGRLTSQYTRRSAYAVRYARRRTGTGSCIGGAYGPRHGSAGYGESGAGKDVV